MSDVVNPPRLHLDSHQSLGVINFNGHLVSYLSSDVEERIKLCMAFLEGVPNEILNMRGKSDPIDLFLSWLQTGDNTPLLALVDELLALAKDGNYIRRSELINQLKRWVKGVSDGFGMYWFATHLSNDLIISTLQMCGMACTKCGGHGSVSDRPDANAIPRQHGSGWRCPQCKGKRVEP